MQAISYTSGPSKEPLIGNTIGRFFDEIVHQYPRHEALVVRHQNIRWTYKQLQEQVNRCAKGLIVIGLKKGERIGIWSPNRSEWLVTQLATAKLGAILVNINPSYRLSELEYALRQSECSMIIIADEYKGADYSEMIYTLWPELKNKSDQTCSKLPQLRNVIRLTDQYSAGMMSWKVLIQRSQEIQNEILEKCQSDLHFDEPINIQYTSGTTGFPKGATLSHHNILNNGYFVARCMNFSNQDRLIIPVPLYHCFGMVMGNLGCITHGATMIYPSEGFDPADVLLTAQEEKATAIYGVPTMFIAELNHPEFESFDLSSLRTGIMAGSLCPIEVMKKVKTKMNMPEVQVAYGMTETSPVSCQTQIGAPLSKQVSTVGQVHPHIEVKIIDPENGKVVPLGTSGELCTRGYSVMLGYWNNEQQTADSIDKARWMHTGDLATMDKEGYISIVGRIKDMIIRGGENIYPKEIEEFLYSHPDIVAAQIIGIPDDKYGEEVMAWIKLKDGVKISGEDIKSYCKDQITHFKIPKYYKFTDSFPMTVTGKMRKIEMREISIKELGMGS